jgi:hypothetical protein
MTQDISTRELVARVTKYLSAYQETLRFVLADERGQQVVFEAGGRQTATRSIDGELFLAFLAAEGRWIAIHDIKVVDGETLPVTEDLRELLQRGEVSPVVRRVADRNARFNLGQVRRNFNEPTLPLWLFAPDRIGGVTFRAERPRPRDVPPGAAGPALRSMSFEERGRPTLIMSERGTPVRSRGELLVDPESGAIHRTQLTLRDGRVEVELVTDYGAEPRLGILVPFLFTERYDARADSRRELILCEARYSNYRRFEVTGRIRKSSTIAKR